MTKSAERLHVAQPALSQSIHRLEKELNVPLFISKGRNIVLTKYGEYLKEKLAPVMDALEEIPRELNSMANLDDETIRMNVLAASTLITRSIIDYKHLKENVNFRLYQTAENNACDIDITTAINHGTQNTEDNFTNDTRFIFTEDIFLAVPESSKYAKLSAVNLVDFAKEDFIAVAGSKQFRTICDDFCIHSGFTPHIAFESDSPTAVLNFIAAGIGVAFLPAHSWGKLEKKGLIPLEIISPICRRDIIVTVKNCKRDNSEVVKYFNFLREYLTNLQ